MAPLSERPHGSAARLVQRLPSMCWCGTSMSTLSAKTTGALRSLPTACRFGEGPSWLSTRHWCPRSPPQARLVGQGVALQAPHCSLHDEPKSAPTLSCAGLAAAGSPSLQLKWVAAGVLRPPPSSDSLRGARHAPHRHPRELLPSPRSPSGGLRFCPSPQRAPSQQASCRSHSPAPRMSMESCPR